MANAQAEVEKQKAEQAKAAEPVESPEQKQAREAAQLKDRLNRTPVLTEPNKEYFVRPVPELQGAKGANLSFKEFGGLIRELESARMGGIQSYWDPRKNSIEFRKTPSEADSIVDASASITTLPPLTLERDKLDDRYQDATRIQLGTKVRQGIDASIDSGEYKLTEQGRNIVPGYKTGSSRPGVGDEITSEVNRQVKGVATDVAGDVVDAIPFVSTRMANRIVNNQAVQALFVKPGAAIGNATMDMFGKERNYSIEPIQLSDISQTPDGPVNRTFTIEPKRFPNFNAQLNRATQAYQCGIDFDPIDSEFVVKTKPAKDGSSTEVTRFKFDPATANALTRDQEEKLGLTIANGLATTFNKKETKDDGKKK